MQFIDVEPGDWFEYRGLFFKRCLASNKAILVNEEGDEELHEIPDTASVEVIKDD